MSRKPLALPRQTHLRWVWAAAMPVLWALGWTVTTLGGIAVDQQFTVFGAYGAVTFSALSGLLLHLLAAPPRRAAGPRPAGTRPDRGDGMTTARHVIFGTGAIGLATFDALRRRGETVRLVNRSGHARVPDDVEVIGGDARDPAFTTAVAQGARVVYQTLNPPYPEWTAQFPALQAGVLAAAEATGARLVSMENVYMYGRPAGHPLTEDRAYDAHTKKGQLRGRMARELLAAHHAGRVQVAIGRASDYFGPRGGAQSNLGDRVFPAALAGKTATVLGDPDQPHTYTYIPDIGEGLAVLGEHPDAPGQVWHLPNDPDTRTTRQLVDIVYQHAGQPRAKLRAMPAAAAARPRPGQPHRARTRRDAIPVRGALHRRQQQDHHQARRPRHPHRPGPRRHPRHLPRRAFARVDHAHHAPLVIAQRHAHQRNVTEPRSEPDGQQQNPSLSDRR